MISYGFVPRTGDGLSQTAASLDDWFTPRQVAELFGVTALAVTRMIQRGRLKAEKKDWMLLIHKSNLPTSWPPPIAP